MSEIPTEEEHAWVVPVPRDLESDVLIALGDMGVDASTMALAGVQEGTVRVSRTGGHLKESEQRDRAEGLVEVWAKNSVDAFDMALAPWAALRIVAQRGVIVPGVAVSDVSIDPPRAMDDPDRPELYRVQFAFQITLPLQDVRIIAPEEAPQ